jgi:hypothetical protein
LNQLFQLPVSDVNDSNPRLSRLAYPDRKAPAPGEASENNASNLALAAPDPQTGQVKLRGLGSLIGVAPISAAGYTPSLFRSLRPVRNLLIAEAQFVDTLSNELSI